MKVLVVGGNFAGSTAAMEIKRKLRDKVEVTLIDRSPDFIYIPSLIWVPTGRREVSDISVSRKGVLEKKGVKFVQDTALKVDTEDRVVYTGQGKYFYDHLIIATGPKVRFDAIPGLKEHGVYIGTPAGAMETRKKLEAFVKDPGPVVIGATQGAGCMGAAYEFLFNLEQWLREKKVRKKTDLHWITPEPYLGHFGIDGMPLGEAMLKKFMQMFNITWHTSVGVKEVLEDAVELSDGTRLSSRFTMLMPPFTGVDFVENSEGLQTGDNRFIPTLPTYRHKHLKNVWAAGLAVDVAPPFKQGKIPFSLPKTGYPSDATGKIVAHNVVNTILGIDKMEEKPWGDIAGLCVMDAGKKEVLILSNKLFKPRKFAIMIPNVLYDFFKVFLEKYFLWKLRHGYSSLP